VESKKLVNKFIEAVPVNTGASQMIPKLYMPALKQEIESQGNIKEVTGATP